MADFLNGEGELKWIFCPSFLHVKELTSRDEEQ